MKWDIGGSQAEGVKDRNFELKSLFGSGTRFDLRGDFNLDFDSMDAVFAWKSNIPGHEAATLQVTDMTMAAA